MIYSNSRVRYDFFKINLLSLSLISINLFAFPLLNEDEDQNVTAGCYEITSEPDAEDLSRDKRHIVVGAGGLWPGGIVYYRMQWPMSVNTQQLWRAAISEWESQTCIRFRPVPADQNWYVTLAEGEKGEHCASKIGYGRYTSQISPGCLNRGSAMHELGHVLGMHHAHNRPDRDQYIEVNSDNISPKARDQFEIRRAGYPLDAFPYDFDSIMHYGAYAFSRDGEPSITIEPAWRARMAEADPSECGDTRYSCIIGQKNHLSEVDVAMVNDVYLCNGKKLSPPR